MNGLPDRPEARLPVHEAQEVLLTLHPVAQQEYGRQLRWGDDRQLAQQALPDSSSAGLADRGVWGVVEVQALRGEHVTFLGIEQLGRGWLGNTEAFGGGRRVRGQLLNVLLRQDHRAVGRSRD